MRAQTARDAGWYRAARAARWLAWASLAWMYTEGAVELWQGLAAGSIALTGWALGGAVEGLASVIVIWRFTGTRTLSENAEHHARHAVAVSFFLLAPYVAAVSVRDLAVGHHAETTAIGIALTAVALAGMPLLGRAKHKLGARLGSAATAGKAPRTTCAPPRPPPSSSGWPSPPPGRPAGGPTPPSAWASPPSQYGKASSPAAATTAVDWVQAGRAPHHPLRTRAITRLVQAAR